MLKIRYLYLPRSSDNVTGVKRSAIKHHRDAGLRSLLQEYRPVVTLAALVLAVGSILFVIWYQASTEHSPRGAQEFFSDDDGTSWFIEDATKVPPFDHNGKSAVIAKVFQTKSGKRFVGYLIKFSDEQKKKMLGSRSTGTPHGPQTVEAQASSGILLKKPHGGDWIPDNDPAAQAIRKFTAPDGSTDFQPVPAGE